MALWVARDEGEDELYALFTTEPEWRAPYWTALEGEDVALDAVDVPFMLKPGGGPVEVKLVEVKK